MTLKSIIKVTSGYFRGKIFFLVKYDINHIPGCNYGNKDHWTNNENPKLYLNFLYIVRPVLFFVVVFLRGKKYFKKKQYKLKQATCNKITMAKITWNYLSHRRCT